MGGAVGSVVGGAGRGRGRGLGALEGKWAGPGRRLCVFWLRGQSS